MLAMDYALIKAVRYTDGTVCGELCPGLMNKYGTKDKQICPYYEESIEFIEEWGQYEEELQHFRRCKSCMEDKGIKVD